MSYPITNPNSASAVDTGRIVYIDDPTVLTPRKFMQFINEGFVPVARIEEDGVIIFLFVFYGETEGANILVIGDDVFSSEDIDTAYALSE